MKKILIIADDAAYADQLKTHLGAEYQVEICPDGQSGYYAIYEFKPDVVLLDLAIAQMNPVSLVGKMKAQKQFSRLPIYVVADRSTMHVADEALAAGASSAFLKSDDGSAAEVAQQLTSALAPSLSKAFSNPKPNGAAAGIPAAPILVSPMPVISMPQDAAAPRVALPLNGNGKAAPPHRVAPSLSDTTFLSASAVRDFARGGVVQAESGSETDFGAEYDFVASYGAKAHSLRKEFIGYRTAQGPERRAFFERFAQQLSSLNHEAQKFGFIGLGRYLTAIETRVKQLLDSLDAITPASLQVLAAALDVLAALDNHAPELKPLNTMTPHALVVDDENVSRKALCLGLEKAKLKATSVDNPDAAIHEAEATPFDIIFLDVELPKMNGFALCARIRIIPKHRKTPILFVTSLSDMKSRASSRVSGGNQFLTKPLNYPELTVNAWTLIIRRRILEDAHLARVNA